MQHCKPKMQYGMVVQYSPCPNNTGTTNVSDTMLSFRLKVVLALALTSLIIGFSELRSVSYNDTTTFEKTISARRRLQELEVKRTLVNAISLMGERHSGTNWIADHLSQCFGDELRVSG